MMRMNNIKMTTTVAKDKLLATLKANLAKHSDIVREAREGYVKRAKAALESRLNEIRQGKVVALSFTLSPPQDYSEIYRTSIQMLEWNTEETVDLQPDEFKQLVLDQWDWRDNFLASNSHYSKQAKDWLDEEVGGAAIAAPPADEADYGGSADYNGPVSSHK